MDRAFTSSVITGHFIRPLGLRHFAVLVFRFRLFFRLLADTVGDLYSNYSSRKVRTVPWVSTIMVNRNSNRKVLQTCSFPAILRSLEGYVCPSLQRNFSWISFLFMKWGLVDLMDLPQRGVQIACVKIAEIPWFRQFHNQCLYWLYRIVVQRHRKENLAIQNTFRWALGSKK